MPLPARPQTPEGRPPKRKASSPPEEGEVDDEPNGASSASAAAGPKGKFKIPFPFKVKADSLGRGEPSRVSDSTDSRGRHTDRYQHDLDRSYRPPNARGYYAGETHRQTQDGIGGDRYGRSRATGGGPRRTNSGAGDHYEPTSPQSSNRYTDSHRRERERNDTRISSRDADYENGRGRVRAPQLDSYVPRSPGGLRSPRGASYDRSPRSLSPFSPRGRRSRSRSRTRDNEPHKPHKHRLPTPRSYTASSPNNSWNSSTRDELRERRIEPYNRNRYQDRERDPRGQYRKDVDDDSDRYYRPSGPGDGIQRPLGYSPRASSPLPRKSLSPKWPSPPEALISPGVRIETKKGMASSNLPPKPTNPPPPSSDPPPPPPSNVSELISAPEELRAHEAVSFALKRPGAPHNDHSPPSMIESVSRSTPAPPTVMDNREFHGLESGVNFIPKKKRLPVRRTREEEKEAYRRVFVGCGQRDDYDIMTKLGEGTFGEVHKAINKHTQVVVALKRILMHNEKEGMPVTALREIKILKALNHPCIVNLLDMFVVAGNGKDSPMSVYMVFPYMDHDLAGLLENERVKLTPSQIKLYMKQLLEGTEYMHHNNIVHRDMKAANLLISNNGSLKIADFGLARTFEPMARMRQGRERRYTNCVVTRWYRPPELLLGARQYGGEIDIWGIGCVLGEMFMRRPIFPGTEDMDQLDKIWQVCGSPNQQNWPDYDKLPNCNGQLRFRPMERRVKQVYESLGKETSALLDRLLVLDPRERITASDALDHEYFWSDPLPADPRSLPIYEASHELDQRGKRQQAIDLPRPLMNQHSTSNGLPPPLHRRNGPNVPLRNSLAYVPNNRNPNVPAVVPPTGPASLVQMQAPRPQPTQPFPKRLPQVNGAHVQMSSNTLGPANDGHPTSRPGAIAPKLLPPRPPGLPARPGEWGPQGPKQMERELSQSSGGGLNYG